MINKEGYMDSCYYTLQDTIKMYEERKLKESLLKAEIRVLYRIIEQEMHRMEDGARLKIHNTWLNKDTNTIRSLI